MVLPPSIERLSAALSDHYRIERELGEGGMATVYLADDLRHERKVALKVLKPELAAVVGAERFLAEIKTTANLQHPHILPLFDSGEADGFLFYVMPYVEGETLRDRLDRERQLPVDEALGIATAVANALQTAHEAGVVHRDIKPGNILLSRGEPLIADFGIALAVGAAGSGRLTETGLSLGTPYYMSPEQATGDQAVGPASDTFALACVLYEMLVGEPPYPGNTAQAVLGKIIQGTPVSATAVRKSIPANVDAAIRKALEKLPADRFTDVRSFARALADPAFRHGEETGSAAAAERRARLWKGWALTATASTLALAGALTWSATRPEPPRPVERFGVPFLEGQEPDHLGSAGYALSPDGTTLAYRLSRKDGTTALMIRRWDDLTATEVRETSNATAPRFSPDGRELAFTQDGAVKVLALAGGPVRTLFPQAGLTVWGGDGFVYAATDSGVVRVPSSGGAVEYVSRLAEGDRFEVVADVLPGGKGALAIVLRSERRDIRALDLSTGKMRFLVEGNRPRYLPSGYLVYEVGAGTMMAARFDPTKMELLGTPVPVMDGAPFWSLSDNGKLFYTNRGSTDQGGYQPVWVSRDDKAVPVDSTWSITPDGAMGLSLSPDGTMIAVRQDNGTSSDIWVKTLGGAFQRLTVSDADEKFPVWEPGTSNVTFLSNRKGNYDVWSRRADGAGDAKLLLDAKENLFRADWSPDGKYLLLQTAGRGDILTFRPGVDSAPTPLLASRFREGSPAVSPDGHWIAYDSDESGRDEVYVAPFPDVNSGRKQVSIDGGWQPKWAHSGRELFFERAAGSPHALMSVEIQTSPRLVVGRPAPLFPSPTYYGSGTVGNVYDFTTDDQRFLFARRRELVDSASDGTRPDVVLVNNFTEVLRQMVPK